MKVHVLLHVPFEGLGYMETWLQENGHNISFTRFYEAGYHLPTVSETEALIVMGGPMGVDDEEQFGWLHQEKIFIRECIQADKKVLGVCLGAQLIAASLGAKVGKAEHKEIGWFPVTPSREAGQSSWLYELFKSSPTVFHWHGDQFGIPGNDISNLLVSEANTNQAFCYNDRVIGLQFHLEATAKTTALMLENGAAELISGPFIQSAAEISSGMRHIPSCNRIMDAILSQWLERGEKA